MNKHELIKSSYHRFRNLKNARKKDIKFKKLPYWLNNISHQFDKEKNNRLPHSYYHYTHGTVIRINFGVNPGSEFSFTHFAVVLDKEDNAKKKTITVLPLTSKPGQHRYPLGKAIFDQTNHVLRRRLKRLERHAYKVQRDIKHARRFNQRLRKELNNLSRNIKQIHQVLQIYQEFDKSSFVRLTDITTVSKLKIQRLNKYDPSGSIKLRPWQMLQISKQLVNLYLDTR